MAKNTKAREDQAMQSAKIGQAAMNALCATLPAEITGDTPADDAWRIGLYGAEVTMRPACLADLMEWALAHPTAAAALADRLRAAEVPS